MSPPTALSVLRTRAVVAEELRRLLPRMEGLRAEKPIPFGLPAIDRYLPQGGLAGGALHEVLPEEGATPAAFGFVVALLARLSQTGPSSWRSRPMGSAITAVRTVMACARLVSIRAVSFWSRRRTGKKRYGPWRRRYARARLPPSPA